MEGGLATAEGFSEGGAAISAEIGLLVWGDGADFSSAACVDGCEFGGDDVWWWWWGRIEWRFRGEEAGYEIFLKTGCCCVGNEAS